MVPGGNLSLYFNATATDGPEGQLQDRGFNISVNSLGMNNMFDLMLVSWFDALHQHNFTSTAMIMSGWSVSSSHIYFLGKLDIVVNQYVIHILLLVTETTLLESAERSRVAVEIYFLINIYGPGSNSQPLDLQTSICSQTCYRLRYAALFDLMVAHAAISVH